MKKLHVGDDADIRASFTVFATKSPVDPTGIHAVITSPSGVVTTQDYPGSIAKLVLGVFLFTVDCTEYGTWVVKVTSSGPGKAGAPTSFKVWADNE